MLKRVYSTKVSGIKMTKSHYFSVFPFDKSEYFRVVLIRKNCIEGPLYIFLEACYSLAPTNFNLDWKLIITSLQFDTLTFSILLIVTCSILLLVHGFCSHPGKGSRGLFSRCGILVQSLTDLTPHCQVFFFLSSNGDAKEGMLQCLVADN